MPFGKLVDQNFHLGSVLVDDTIYFLHTGKEVISIDTQSLNLGTTKLPDHGQAKKIKSRTSHFLSREPGGRLCVAAVSGRRICIYSYSNASTTWEETANWSAPNPSSTTGKGIKLIGSAENEGLILLKVGSLDIFSIEIKTGLVKQVAMSGSNEEVLVYEQECPAVSQILQHI